MFLLDKSQLDKEEKQYRELLDKDPTNAETVYKLGNLFLKKKDLKAAAEVFLFPAVILIFWGPLLLSVPFENAFNLSGGKVAVVIIVYHHNRRKETCSQAGNSFKGITHVFGRFIRFNAQG